jgi:hypothetical protein
MTESNDRRVAAELQAQLEKTRTDYKIALEKASLRRFQRQLLSRRQRDSDIKVKCAAFTFP